MAEAKRAGVGFRLSEGRKVRFSNKVSAQIKICNEALGTSDQSQTASRNMPATHAVAAQRVKDY